VESVREVTTKYAQDDKRYGDNRRDGRYADDRYVDPRYERYGRDDRYNAAGAIELFNGEAFRGRGVTLERDARDLDRFGLDERVSSMIVHEGTWEICSEAGYDGRCRTYGPGRYPTLGRMSNQIGSVRRVG
jgi:hypothetical protein